ncbi:MAG TPA: nitroreductase family protein [Pseudonocardiaceae bacterium]
MDDVMKDDVKGPDVETIYSALEVACRAPSVHNTQPWRWVIAPHSLHLFADSARRLPVIDASGRELIISCGATLHHVRSAFRALGWRADAHRLPNPADRDHLAALEFAPLPRIDSRSVRLVTASSQRHTDRRPYLPDRVPTDLLDRVAGAANAEHVRVTPVLDATHRRDLMVALAQANTAQRENPMYKAELSEWSHRHLGAVEGVPAAAVPMSNPLHRGMPGREFDGGELDSPPALDDGASLMVLSTGSDDKLDWLRAGEALSAALLVATSVGLATCTLSQVGEVRSVRDLVRHTVLHDVSEPQLVIRLGWPATADYPGPETPRRPMSDIVSNWDE